MIKFEFIASILIFSIICVISEVEKTDTSDSIKQETDVSDDTPKTDENIAKSKEPSKTDDEVVKREEEAISIDGLNIAQVKELREKAEKYAFRTEVDRMMKLIINSLYKNKEIFLRELISNSSDALDKIRFISLTSMDQHIDNDDLLIKIKADRVSKTLHILDNGVGMTKEELITNLGTIARSGTSEFINRATQESNSQKNSAELTDLIGQFGVGFYSSFLVADRVTVVSKSDASAEQYIWESNSGSFTISPDPRGSTLKRGTEVILHLREEAHEYLEIDKLTELIHKYSQFINFPIYLWSSQMRKVSATGADQGSTAVSKSDEDATVSEEAKESKGSEEKLVYDWKLINKSKPIWSRRSSEISEEEYNEFYKSFTKDTELPLAKTHFSAEGEVAFKAILYVPKKGKDNQDNQQEGAPQNEDTSSKLKDNIKLYVKRVFITDNWTDFLPHYLNFIRGIVDSDDLPLNVSRETLQQHKLLKLIKKKLIRKTLDMLKKMPEEKYTEFWEEYGSFIKIGVMEDSSNRNRLAKLLRFSSSYSDTELTSLSQYVSRMKPDQQNIYFISGTSVAELKNSAMVETLLANKYEVLFLTKSVDEYAVNSITEFEGKKFQSAAKEGLKLAESEKIQIESEKAEKEYDELKKWLVSEESGLQGKIERVTLSERLKASPAVIVAHSQGMTGNMERVLRAQSYNRLDSTLDSTGPAETTIDEYIKQDTSRRILEINPSHPLIIQLKNHLKQVKDRNQTKKLAQFIHDSALLKSGFLLPDVRSFTNHVDEILRTALDIPIDAPIMSDEEEEIMEDSPRQTPAKSPEADQEEENKNKEGDDS